MTDASDRVARIADAVLYEGYVLWPYRRSALKNQRRWTFGGVYPPLHSAAHPDDPGTMRTECLVEGGADARIEIRVRFLHVVARGVVRERDGGRERVDALTVGDERYVSWDEATEREAATGAIPLGELASSPHTAPIDFPAGESEEELRDASGRRAGALVHSWRGLAGTVEVSAVELDRGLHRLRVEVRNESDFQAGDREEALRQTFCATHTILCAKDGRFVSLTDPPPQMRAQVDRCENVATWPVLVGADGERDTMLSSPIILPDYPRIAPESPGDLFDGGEIDQLLTLSILSLTDEERQEMRESDPRVREILERTASLTPEQLMRLHGAIRERGLATRKQKA